MLNLSRTPGSRPFKKKGTQMEDNSKEINDIVSRTANVIGCGKKFGGWTDNSTNEAFLRNVTKRKAFKGDPGEPESVGKGLVTASDLDATLGRQKRDRNFGKSGKHGVLIMPANTKPKKDEKKGSLVGRIIRGMLSAGEPTKKGDVLLKLGPDSSRPENERQYTKTRKVESVVHENVSNLSHGAKGLLSAAINATHSGGGPEADHGNVHFFKKPAHSAAMKFLATKEMHPDHKGSHEELKKYFPESVDEAVWGGVAGSMVGRGVAGRIVTQHGGFQGGSRALARAAGDQAGWWIGDKLSGNREKKRQKEQARLQAQQQ